MRWLWTWGGKCFGYRDDSDNLWTHDGRHIGRFSGDEVYDTDGEYLGEIMNDNRLITHCSKKFRRGPSFSPHAGHVGFVSYADYVGNVMYAGHEDFPDL